MTVSPQGPPALPLAEVRPECGGVSRPPGNERTAAWPLSPLEWPGASSENLGRHSTPRAAEHCDEAERTRISLWFVTPAHRRVDLARICFAQHAWAHRRLAEYGGIDATSCVIADDENLDAAAEHGFVTIERNNEHLGGKLNDGYEKAARSGADYVMPIGSDDWIDPALIIANLPPPDEIGAHRFFASVRGDGERIAELHVDYVGGNGIRIIPTPILAPLEYRPVAEKRSRSVDGSTQQRLARALRARGQRLGWRYVDLHPFQTVGFQTYDEQLTPYGPLVEDHLVREHGEPWQILAECYPRDLVDRMQAHYAEAA